MIIRIAKIFVSNFLVLIALIYLIEIGINIHSGNFLKKTRYQHLKDLSQKYEESFFYNFLPYKLLDEKGLQLLPLSGYHKSWTLLCLDGDKPIYYKSDENGFNNPLSNNSNILLLGDSYIQGMCVDNKKNINSLFINKKNLKTSAIGIGGHGPLSSLAVLKEYGEYYKHKKLIYFITPDNDFYDLENETKNPILLSYLNDKLFTQNLIEKKHDIKKIIDSYFEKTLRPNREFLRSYHLDFHNVRAFIKSNFIKETKENNNFVLYAEIDQIFLDILNEMNQYSFKKNNEFKIVFNLISPHILFPTKENDKKIKKDLLNKIEEIKKYLKQNSINYYDFNEYVLQNYSELNIHEIVHFNNGRWDHYSELGNEIIVDQVYQYLIK
jgi:hypothetical protein